MEKRDVVVYSEDYKKLLNAKAYAGKYYEIDERVEEICKEAFKGCDKLEEIVMPKKLKKIDSEAFQGCSSLTKLTLPDSVMSIRDEAFRGCSGLTELTLPNSVASIGDSAFAYCSGLTELTLPNSITSIGYSAFYGCSGLTELTLPNSVTSIGDSAFYVCRGLEKITVESGNSCYDSRDNCNSIIDKKTNTLIVGCKNSIIPNSVTSIGSGAFAYCSGLAKITSLAEIPPVCGSGVFDGVNKTNCELIVPIMSVTAYKQAEVWNEFSNISGFSGVEDTVADGNTIRAIGNQIEISGDFTSVEVYGINGALIYKGKDNVVTVPSAGIYLVHVAGKTRKIVVE